MLAVITPNLIDERQGTGWKSVWLVPVLFVAASAACLSIDVPIANTFEVNSHKLPKAVDGPLEKVLENCEVFGHGVGATLIVIAVVVLDPLKLRSLHWLFAGSLGSGLVANSIKLFVYRTRPRVFDFETGTVWKSFLSASSGGMDVQSFPSAHTATAVGLAVMLASLYPRGRWFFFLLAALVGLQRVFCSAHFPSDVFAGATVGWLVGTICATSLPQERNANVVPHATQRV
jgi:membrane-associated phospholipid phosphatase